MRGTISGGIRVIRGRVCSASIRPGYRALRLSRQSAQIGENHNEGSTQRQCQQRRIGPYRVVSIVRSYRALVAARAGPVTVGRIGYT